MDSKSAKSQLQELGEGRTEILGPEEEKRLVRKIDRNLLPILIIAYGLQYLDKTSLSYAAILDLRKSLHLVGQEYSWTSSIFYIGYLAACYPISLGFVKYPLGKYISIIIVIWGAILAFHTLAANYAGMMVLRTFLGALESAISPGFSLITSMWYTPREHVSRHSFWFAGNACASLIGSGVAYGILHYKGSIAPWRVLFLVFGLITVAYGAILWVLLPDSPENARFLSAVERELASLRPKKFQHTSQTKKWSKEQFIETLKDPKSWWFLFFVFVISIPNGGTTSFSTLIINGFGYDSGETILMGMPASAFQLLAVILAAVVTSNLRGSRLYAMAFIYLCAIGGCLMIMLIPTKNKLARLGGFWIITAVAPIFPLMLSLFASNTAGFTKKSTTSAFIFVGYCVGNLAGPQFFISTEAPHYPTAYKTILSCFSISIIMILGLRFYLFWENKRRDKAQGIHIDAEDSREIDLHTDKALAALDETDWENKSFRYVL
ncbi:major facilitator superfamily domain-containing protein [Tricladium varicosporioides]|nr:major facilitator superfamily domain-containing protein [Hymenoscyphus varicosporioides]